MRGDGGLEVVPGAEERRPRLDRVAVLAAQRRLGGVKIDVPDRSVNAWTFSTTR